MPAPGARSAARSAGLKWYSTGQPCPNGHLSERLTSNGACYACATARARLHWANRPAKEIAPGTVTRAAAKSAGLKRYFTGKPCKHGHFAERRTDNGSCLNCLNGGVDVKDRAKAPADKEEARLRYNAYMREWRATHPSPRRGPRPRKPANLAQIEQSKARSRAWRKQNPDRWRRIQARLAKRNREATPAWLSERQREQIKEFYWLAQDCRITSGIEYHVDHIVPLNGKNVCGLHVPWNLQVLPGDINRAKSNRLAHPTKQPEAN